METDLVSVVVPAYNASLYLKQTLESALSQTYRNFEVIVVDDGSTDDTPCIAKGFGDSIRYIHQSNRGLSAARNTAIKNARADIIALLDSDDLWEPQFLEKMVWQLSLNPKAAGVYCGFHYINSKGEVVGQPSLLVVPPKQFHEMMVNVGNWLAPCSVLFRKRLIDQVGFFDESLHAVEDWDMWIRMSEHATFVGLQEALVRYRRHENNMSKNPERMVKAIGQLTEKQHGLAEGHPSRWSPAKQMAFREHYRGGAISFFAVGSIEKSIEYLQKLVEVAPDYTCSLKVWRNFARAHIPEEYQFENFPPHNWALMQNHFTELFNVLGQRVDHSSTLSQLYPKIKSYAFLALADEAGRSKETLRACRWLIVAIRADSRLLFERPFWGTLFRGLVALFTPSPSLTKIKAARS